MPSLEVGMAWYLFSVKLLFEPTMNHCQVEHQEQIFTKYVTQKENLSSDKMHAKMILQKLAILCSLQRID